MPTKLSTLVSKIQTIPNPQNSKIIEEFYQYMKENGASEKHMAKIPIATAIEPNAMATYSCCFFLCALLFSFASTIGSFL